MANLVADDGSGIRVGYLAPIFMGVFYGPPTKERLQFLFEHEKKWVGDLPKFGAISLIDPMVGKEMNGEARAQAKEITDFFADRMLCSCTIVEGSGFFPALVRSVLASIQLLSRRSGSAMVVASTFDDAITKLTASGLTFDGPAVKRALEELVAPIRKRVA